MHVERAVLARHAATRLLLSCKNSAVQTVVWSRAPTSTLRQKPPAHELCTFISCQRGIGNAFGTLSLAARAHIITYYMAYDMLSDSRYCTANPTCTHSVEGEGSSHTPRPSPVASLAFKRRLGGRDLLWLPHVLCSDCHAMQGAKVRRLRRWPLLTSHSLN